MRRTIDPTTQRRIVFHVPAVQKKAVTAKPAIVKPAMAKRALKPRKVAPKITLAPLDHQAYLTLMTLTDFTTSPAGQALAKLTALASDPKIAKYPAEVQRAQLRVQHVETAIQAAVVANNSAKIDEITHHILSHARN